MTQHAPRPAHRFTLAMTVALALAGAVPAAAQTLADTDRDGVADLVDLCPATPTGDFVTAEGCSVCPCEAAWPTHQAYVDCVTAEAYRLFNLKLISRTRRSQAISAAKNSTCGTPYIRCCAWRKLVYGSMGSCTVMDPARCSYYVLGKWAEIRGTGSCVPNPCTW
jgi:hypothetical protein